MSTAIETDFKLWATLIGWFVMIFGSGAVWGGHRRQLTEHQKAIDGCKMEDLMTEDKCKEFYETHQESTDNKLNNIEAMLTDMKTERRDINKRLGRMASRVDVIYDRWERQHG